MSKGSKSIESPFPGAVVGSQVMREIASPTGTTVARIIIRLWSPAWSGEPTWPLQQMLGLSNATPLRGSASNSQEVLQ